METSKIAAIIALVVIVGAVVAVLASPNGVSLAPRGKQSCVWVSGFFNPVEETENLGGSDCTGNDYDPFKTGSILYTVNGITYNPTDFCASGNLMNEYWCTNGAGQRVLGYCTLGCKTGTNSVDSITGFAVQSPTGSCVNRVRVCTSAFDQI